MSRNYLPFLILTLIVLQSCGISDERKLEEKTKKLEMLQDNIKYLYKEISYGELELVKLTVNVKDSASKSLADKQRFRMDSLKKEMVTANNKADSLRSEIAELNKLLFEKK